MKRISVRPGKGQSMAGAVMGVVMVCIGVAIVIPTFGGIGIAWTLFAIIMTIVNFYNAFSDKGISTHRIYVEDVDNNNYQQSNLSEQNKDSKSRLYDLEELYRQQLITQEEYESKRKEILKDL